MTGLRAVETRKVTATARWARTISSAALDMLWAGAVVPWVWCPLASRGWLTSAGYTSAIRTGTVGAALLDVSYVCDKDIQLSIQ